MLLRLLLLLAYLSTSQARPMTVNIVGESAKLLGRPYQRNPLGEGSQAYFDQAPSTRLDAFDCQTYVNTVLALALTKKDEAYQNWLTRLRYHALPPRFLSRNHFVSTDLNPHWHRLHVTQDFTQILSKTHTKTSTAIIDKTSWLQHLPNTRVRLINNTPSEQHKRYQVLRAKHLPSQVSRITYLPIQALFKNGKPNTPLLQHIPSGTILEIVRPNWNLTLKMGTHLQVSHLGFVIHTTKGLMFRHAAYNKTVMDTPLIPYLSRYQNTNIGIHLELPRMP